MRERRDGSTHGRAPVAQYACATCETAVRMREALAGSTHARVSIRYYAYAILDRSVRMRTFSSDTKVTVVQFHLFATRWHQRPWQPFRRSSPHWSSGGSRYRRNNSLPRFERIAWDCGRVSPSLLFLLAEEWGGRRGDDKEKQGKL